MNLKKISGYALGPLGSAAVGIITLPLLSWLYPAEDIARIILLQTVASLTLILVGMGLDQAYIREYHAAANKAALFRAVLLPPLLLTAVLFALVLIVQPWRLSAQVFNLPNNALGIFCLLFFSASVLTRYLSLILRMNERAFAFSFSQLAPKLLVLALLLLCAAVGLPADTFTLAATYAAAQVLTMMMLAIQTKDEWGAALKTPLDRQILRQSLRYGIPLAIGGLAYWAFSSIDRFALQQFSGLNELGIYSIALNFGAAALIFQNIFAVIWAPMVFRWVAENKNLNQIGNIASDITAAVTAIICLVGIFSPLVPLILPDHYASVQFILLSSIMFPLLYTLTEVSGIGLNVVKRTWLITLVNIAACAVNISLLYLLVPHFGARGAAASIAVSFWIFFLMKTELSSRLWQPLPRLKIYAQTLLCLLMCLLYTFWGNTGRYPVFAALWLLILALLGKQYRNRLQQAFAAVKSRLKH